MFPILAIETTDELCSAALLESENKYSEINILGKHVHSEKLIPVIESLLAESKVKIDSLSCIAISEGPGSFTGLRIGMAAAKGLAVGANLQMVLVPTLEALAYRIKDYLPANQKFAILRKASRDDVYFVKYVVENEKLVELKSLSLIEKNNLQNHIDDNEIVFSNLGESKDLVSPSAVDIGNWAYKFGKDLVTSEYDLLEPKYIKEFVVRR